MTFFEQEERLAWLLADDASLSRQCDLDFHKASGHGGQKVNKTSSAVRILHRPTGITAVSAVFRSQTENRHDALAKLRFRIALECRVRPAGTPETNDLPSLSNKATYLPWLAAFLDFVLTETPVPGLSASRKEKLLRRDPDVWRFYSEWKTAAKPSDGGKND